MINLKLNKSIPVGKEMKQLIDFPYIVIYEVTGLEPVASSISTKKTSKDGTTFQGKTKNERNIVISGCITKNVKENRHYLYDLFETDDIPLEMIFDDKYFIEGYLENIEMNNYQERTTFQISMICPDPFFYTKEVEVIGKYSSEKEGTDFICERKNNDWIVEVNFNAGTNSFVFCIDGVTEYKIDYGFKQGDILTVDYKNRTVEVNNTNIYGYKKWVEWGKLSYNGNFSYLTNVNCNAVLKYKNKYNGI